MSNNYKIETKCIQSGWQPTKGEPRVLPIYQSTTFKYDVKTLTDCCRNIAKPLPESFCNLFIRS